MSTSNELPDSELDGQQKIVSPPSTSATTNDIPSFGWSTYAERVNGRFAMVGFIAILIIEIVSKTAFLSWSGFTP